MVEGNVLGGLENAIADLLRGLDLRVDRRDDADEHALSGLHILPDDLQHLRTVRFTGERDVEAAGFQLKQAWQQFGVVDVGTVGRVAVTAGTRVDTDALPVLV